MITRTFLNFTALDGPAALSEPPPRRPMVEYLLLCLVLDKSLQYQTISLQLPLAWLVLLTF